MLTKAEQYVEDTQKAEKFVGGARDSLAGELKSLRNQLTQDWEAKHGKRRFGKPASAEDLAAFDALAERLVNGEDLNIEQRRNEESKSRYGTYRYSNDLLDGISAVYKKVRGRSGFTSDHKGLLDRVARYIRLYAQRADMLESANKGEQKTKQVPTSYRMESRKLDEGRVSDYWTQEHEMLARAFSGYVEDMAATKGIQSDFLSYGADNSLPGFRLLGVRPYPEGAERTAINKAFEKLFKALEVKETDKGVALASISPGKHLPPPSKSQRGMSVKGVKDVASKLNTAASNASPVNVVQSFTDLPANLQRVFQGRESAIEGVYDPESKTTWFVADNLTDLGRVAEVWAHEQLVHHGLRGMLPKADLNRVLNRLWHGVGGLGNAKVREIAERYDLNPRSNESDRMRVMEEVVASMAERRASGLLSQQEQSLWRRIVNAIKRAFDSLALRFSGRESRFGYENIDGLLSDLSRFVMDGVPANTSVSGQAAASLAETGSDPLVPLASILGMKASETLDAAQSIDVEHIASKEDIGLLGRAFRLPQWVAESYAGFKPIFDRQVRRMNERMAALEKSLSKIPSLFGDKNLTKQDEADLNKLIWDNEGRAIPELEENTKYRNDGEFENGRKRIKPNEDYYKAYQKWLDKQPGSKAAKQAMLEIRKALDNAFAHNYNILAAMKDADDTLIDQMRKNLGEVPNYFPHMRKGKYYVLARDKDSKVVYRQHYDAMLRDKAAARKIAQEQAKNYPNAVKWEYGKVEALPDEAFASAFDPNAMEAIINAAADKIGNKEEAAKIKKAMATAIADTLKSRGFGKHTIERKGTPGHETQDVQRLLYDYLAGMHGWASKMEASADFTKLLSKLQASKTPKLWSYAMQYVEDMLRNSDTIDRVAGNVKSGAFAWYLGLNIKSAVASNLSQNFIVGIPRLQMDADIHIGKYLNAAWESVANSFAEKAGGKSSLGAEEMQMLKHLKEKGIITDAYTAEMQGRLDGIDNSLLWHKFIRVMSIPMSATDKFNRASIALAAYRAAKDGKLKESARKKYGIGKDGKATNEQARAFASDIALASHFIYGRSNAPEIFRGSDLGRMISPTFTFRSFVGNLLNMWYWALTSQGAEGRKFFAKSIATSTVLGGLTAFPLYATIAALGQMLTGDDEDWTARLRRKLPENNLFRDMVMYGAPAITGFTIGSTLRIETPVTRGLTGRGTTYKDVAIDSLAGIIGIPWALAIERPNQLFEAAKHRNVPRAVEALVPTFAANMSQAWRLWTEGQTTVSGRPINVPGRPGTRKLTTGEAIGKALGFQPVSNTKSFAAFQAEERAKKVRSDKIDSLTVMALKTMDTGNPAGRARMLRELRTWNDRMRAEGKLHMLIKTQDVQRRMQARRRENRRTPDQMRKGNEYTQTWGL